MCQRMWCSFFVALFVSSVTPVIHAQVDSRPTPPAELKPSTPPPARPNAPQAAVGGIIDAGRQFNLQGTRFLSSNDFGNVYAGWFAGEKTATNTSNNSMFGFLVGRNNVDGHENTFIVSE